MLVMLESCAIAELTALLIGSGSMIAVVVARTSFLGICFIVLQHPLV